MEINRHKDTAKCARFADYYGDITGGKRSSQYRCPVTASKEIRRAVFDKRRSKRIAAVIQEDFNEPPLESKSASSIGEDGYYRGGPLALPVAIKTKLGQNCRVHLAHLMQLLLLCKKLVYTLPPEVIRPTVGKLRESVNNVVYTMEVLPCVTLFASACLQKLTRKAAVVSTLVHIPDSSQSTVTRSSYHCLLRIRRLLKMSVHKTNLVHSCLYYVDPPKYWKNYLNIPFFLKPTTLVYKSSFPKDVMMKALKEYSEAQDAQMTTEVSTNEEAVPNQTSKGISNPNSDVKPQKPVVIEPVFKVPSLECVSKKRSISVLPKATASTDSDSPPSPKRLCQNKVSSQLSSLRVLCSNKTEQYHSVSSPLMKSLSAASTTQGQTSPKPIIQPSQSNAAPPSEVSESPMCTTSSSQENTDSPDKQSPQEPVAENLPIPIPTVHEEKPARAQVGGKQSSTACYASFAKEARKASFDKRRSLGIAAALAEEKKQSAASGSEPEMDDSGESSETSDSEDESSDEEYSDLPNVKIINEDAPQKEQQKMEKRKTLQLQASSFLLQLTKCLNTCKKEVYTLSPNFVKPNVSKLREAVDNALYVAERIKRVSISSTVSLKQLTQSAATVARLVHIPDSMYSTATKSSYHCLLRIRRFLNLSIRVAAVLHAYTEKITKSKSKVKIKMTLSDFAREGDGHMEVAEQSKLTKATISTPSSTHWKASSKVPFFLKPATLVFNSSSHKEVLLNSLKKKLECLPAVQSQDIRMVEPSTGPGKECNFDETCKELHDTLISDQKPVELVVSVPLRKISSSNCVDKKSSTASVLPDLCCPPPAKRRTSNACHQFVLDDVVDVGVVQGSKESMPARETDCNPGVGGMINDFLWQVRHEVVEKQKSGIMASLSVPKGVKKQSIFKSSCKKRFSPYAGRPSSAKTSPCQNEQTKCVVSKTLSLTYESQKSTLSVASSESEQMKPPLSKASIKSLKSYRDPPRSVISDSKPVGPAAHQSTQQQIQKQPILSMDELADLVERKCYPITITESLSKRYSRLSFKDPRQYELTSSVIPRERYPGLILQDGRVRFVLRASPLTPVLFQRMMEGRNMNILSKNLLPGPQIGGATTTTGIHKYKQYDPRGGMAMSPSPFTSPPVCKIQSFNSVIENTIDGVIKKPVSRALLKPTRRRLHPTLSNELAVRKNPQLVASPASDREEYREILGTRVEVNPIGEREEQPRKARLGKRNATDAGLPIPAGK